MALVLAPGTALRKFAVFAAIAAPLLADPLSKKADIDFYRDVASRDLRGLATRADGRIVAGPAFTELAGPATAELLWCLEPAPEGRWLVGTGPEGRIFEVAIDPAKGGYTAREVARLGDSQVFALKRLSDGSILAGTSPKGCLVLTRGGQITARVGLPVDSVFDILLINGGEALVATGNPGRIYRVDLAKFATGGLVDKLSESAALASRGITLFGEIRDRNVRRIARLRDGRIVAGSAPHGNVYVFAKQGGGPLILQENQDAEVTDLMPQDNGDCLAAIVHGGGSRVSDKDKDSSDVPLPARPEKFGGRSVLVRFPADGFPETLAARAGAAFYGLARQGDIVLMAGGEQGEFTGYDLGAQLGLTFAGSASARLSAIAPVPGSPGRFLVVRNNAPGLAWVDFSASGPREATTGQIDLGSPGRLGALRFDRLRDLDERQLSLEIKASNGTDDLEGWSPWTGLSSSGDGWRAGLPLRGRYVKLRLRLSDAAATAEIDNASLYSLPQNRPPELQDFHFLSPNYAIVPPPEQPPAVIATLSQLLQGKDDDKRKNAILSSQVVPSPGTQVAFWTVADPDGDNVVCTFSIRRDGDGAWTDLAVDSRDPYVQFDTAHLPDGVYFTRLVAKEASPRPAAERLSATFETDHLVVDHTPPDILDASVRRTADALVVSVHGRDALSLLDGIEVDFNNGDHQIVEQPADGIRDGREETFVLEEPLARAAGATALDVTLYDATGNARTRHLPLPGP